jgi:hypothetical protein
MARILEISRSIATIPLRLMRAPFVAAGQLRRIANDPSTVGQARRAFVEDVTGRMKAVAGFVLGDDRMLTSGQIERAKSAERLRAVAEEASADAIERKARQETALRIDEARRDREDASRREKEREAAIGRETEREKIEIEAEAAREQRYAVENALEAAIVIDAADVALLDETERAAVAAEATEFAAELARAEAEAIEEASRSGE